MELNWLAVKRDHLKKVILDLTLHAAMIRGEMFTKDYEGKLLEEESEELDILYNSLINASINLKKYLGEDICGDQKPQQD